MFLTDFVYIIDVLLSLPTIILAGLMDRLNPCSVTVLISLAFLLVLAKNKIYSGLAFILAAFTLHFAVGVYSGGIFANTGLISLVNYLLNFLMGLAIISYLLAKLIPGLKSKGLGSLVPKMTWIYTGIASPICALFVGVASALYYLPCTGIIYRTSIELISPLESIVAIPLLFIYNFVFVIPLIILMLVAHFISLKNKTLSKKS